MTIDNRDRIDRLASAIAAFRSPGDSHRKRLCDETPHMTPETMSRGLDLSLEGWDVEGLQALWAQESPHLRDAVFPQVVGVVLGGVLPPSHLQAMVYPLMLGARIVVKAPSADPLFPALFQDCYGDGVTVVDRVAWQDQVTRLDAVITVGDDDSVRDVAAQLPLSTPFVGYGHRTALVCVDGDAVNEELATALATDVGTFDQLGCLSPREVFVRGTLEQADALAAMLSESLSRLPPRFDLGPAIEGAIRTFRDMAVLGDDVLSGAADLSWGVIRSNGGTWTGTPGGRHVVVRQFSDSQAVVDALEPLQGTLSAVATAGQQLNKDSRSSTHLYLIHHQVTATTYTIK